MQRPRFYFVLLPLATLALVSSCAGAPEADTDGSGSQQGYPRSVTSCDFKTSVDSRPKRAITMGQGATEVLLALGLEGQMAATYGLDDQVAPEHADAYKSIPTIKGDNPPSREKMLDDDIDFVYGSYISYFEQKAVGSPKVLKKFGIDAYVSPLGCGTPQKSKPASFKNVWAEVDDIATIFDAEDRADRLIAKQKKQLAKLEKVQAGDGLTVFWYDSNEKTPFAGGGTGTPQIILDTVGAKNIFGNLKGSWVDVSWEKVIDAEPDVIVFADATWSTAAEKIKYLGSDPVLRELEAVKNKRYVTIPFSESNPGVRVLAGAQQVSDQLSKLEVN